MRRIQKDATMQKMPLLWMMSLLHQLKTIVHPSTLIVVAGSCVSTAFMLYGFDADSEEDMEWRDDTNYAAGRVVATLAFFLSFLLTFRLNVSALASRCSSPTERHR